MSTSVQGPWTKYQAEDGPWKKYAAATVTPENVQSLLVRRSQGKLSPEEDAELVRFMGDPANKELLKGLAQKEQADAQLGPVPRFLMPAADVAKGTLDLARKGSEGSLVEKALLGPASFGLRAGKELTGGALAAQGEAGQEYMQKAAAEPNPLRNVERFLEAGVPVVGPVYRSLRKKVEEGDVAGAVGETALNLAGARGVTKPPVPGASVVKQAGRAALEIGRRPQVAQSVVKEAMSLPPRAVSGVEDIFRAAAPTGTKVGFRQNMYAAAGDLAEIAETIDLKKARGGMRNPDLRPRETVNAINSHLSKIDAAERLPQVQRNAQVPVATKLSADAAEGLRYIERSAGREADRALATTMARSETMPLSDLDRLARVVNKELLDFEKLTPDQRAAARVTSRRIGGLKELDKALSKSLNDTLQSRGEVGLRQYERRFAALSQVRDQLQARLNAVELQRSNIVGRVARSAVGGKAGIASASQAAIADVNIGRLLEKGFSSLRQSGLKANRGAAGTPRRVRGLLPESTPPIVTPEAVNQPIPAAGARRYNY